MFVVLHVLFSVLTVSSQLFVISFSFWSSTRHTAVAAICRLFSFCFMWLGSSSLLVMLLSLAPVDLKARVFVAFTKNLSCISEFGVEGTIPVCSVAFTKNLSCISEFGVEGTIPVCSVVEFNFCCECSV